MPGWPLERVIGPPGDASRNGMSIDERSGALFIADSGRSQERAPAVARRSAPQAALSGEVTVNAVVRATPVMQD